MQVVELNKRVSKKTIVLLHGKFKSKALDTLSAKDDVYVLEGRPKLESSQYLTDQLKKRKITPTLIADNMAGFLFFQNMVKEVWISYTQAHEEEIVTPIGSLILAVLGKKHKIPVNAYSQKLTKKYLGSQKDLLEFNGVRVAPRGIKGYVPLVEEVPLKYIGKCYE